MQLTFYDFLYSDVDPVWQKIESLQKDEKVYIGNGIYVYKNVFNLYEIVTDDMHEPFRNKRSCYEKVTQIIEQYSNE